MEKRVTTKIDTFMTGFITGLNKQMQERKLSEEQISSLNMFISSYEKLSFDKSDLVKRKRSQNSVPSLSRCCSKRSNGEQCSRKKKDGYDYCGTHLKGSYGVYKQDILNVKKVEVWAQDIHGIIYYIDKDLNVYRTEDIVNNKTDPDIIAKCEDE